MPGGLAVASPVSARAAAPRSARVGMWSRGRDRSMDESSLVGVEEEQVRCLRDSAEMGTSRRPTLTRSKDSWHSRARLDDRVDRDCGCGRGTREAYSLPVSREGGSTGGCPMTLDTVRL